MATRKNGASKVEPRAEPRPRLLSIVCPAYNEEENLDAFFIAIEAAMRAIAQNFEVVFVNDGSSDATLDVMMRLRAAKGRVAVEQPFLKQPTSLKYTYPPYVTTKTYV